MTIRQSVLRCAAFLLLGGAAFASPAQDLFDQASFYLSFNYHGYSGVNLATLEAKYLTKLQNACGSLGDRCGYNIGEKIVDAMIEEVEDDHTYYLAPDNAEDFASSTTGSSSDEVDDGLLFSFIRDSNELRINEVLENSPAEEAGVKRGDRIVSFNGTLVPQRNALRDLYRALLVEGKTYRLGVLRNESESKEFKVTPRKMAFDDSPWMNVLEGGVARIVVQSFERYNVVGPKLHVLVKRAQSLGIKSLVVDVRDNPGGVFSECLSGVGAFVPSVGRTRETRFGRSGERFENGRLTITDTNGNDVPSNYVIREPAQWAGPVAVLVNRNSASCAEVFAQDILLAKRGQVVGETTYGLGNTSARVFDLVNGGAVVVTFSRTLQPNNQPYPENVTPTLAARDDKEQFMRRGRDALLEKALDALAGRTSTLASSASTALVDTTMRHYGLGLSLGAKTHSMQDAGASAWGFKRRLLAPQARQ